jgi:hypothetical protein
VIHSLADAVALLLKARKYPHPVIRGPELRARDGNDMAIVFERDIEAGDAIVAPMGAKQISPHVEAPFNRMVSGVVTVYARSPLSGATPGDHEDEVDRVCDGVLCAMYRACKTAKLPLAIVSSALLPPSTPEGGAPARMPAGRAAQIRFTVQTLVRDVEYRGGGPLTGVIDDVAEPTVELE